MVDKPAILPTSWYRIYVCSSAKLTVSHVRLLAPDSLVHAALSRVVHKTVAMFEGVYG